MIFTLRFLTLFLQKFDFGMRVNFTDVRYDTGEVKRDEKERIPRVR